MMLMEKNGTQQSRKTPAKHAIKRSSVVKQDEKRHVFGSKQRGKSVNPCRTYRETPNKLYLSAANTATYVVLMTWY